MAKKTKKGVIFPPLVGGSFPNVVRLITQYRVQPKYYIRTFIILLATFFTLPFRLYEKLFNRKAHQHPIEKEPVFILGHWRSGTTYLHNLIAQDPQMGFLNTLQNAFPEKVLGSEAIFKWFMKTFMPSKRPGDNVQMSPDYPQEEEFALGNLDHVYSYYNFWFFPQDAEVLYEKYIRFEGVSKEVRDKWIDTYRKLIQKTLYYHGGSRLVSKNPPHTGRIRELLEMFPDGKFIHIYRNPVTVFLSTRKFFTGILKGTRLHDMTPEELEETIFRIYERMMNDFLEDVKLIPKDQFYEVKFEEFEKKPFYYLKEIYDTVGLPGFEEAASQFQTYIDSRKSYKKNKHQIKKELLDRILNRWGFAMKEWNYDIPEHIEVI